MGTMCSASEPTDPAIKSSNIKALSPEQLKARYEAVG